MVTLEVAKQGAIYHGLATLLNQPSPMMQRSKDQCAPVQLDAGVRVGPGLKIWSWGYKHSSERLPVSHNAGTTLGSPGTHLPLCCC